MYSKHPRSSIASWPVERNVQVSQKLTVRRNAQLLLATAFALVLQLAGPARNALHALELGARQAGQIKLELERLNALIERTASKHPVVAVNFVECRGWLVLG